MVIRKAKISDLEDIIEIENLCFNDPWPDDVLCHSITAYDQIFICAADEKQVFGYVNMQYVLDEGYIGNVAVHPDYRRMGIGKTLIDEIIKEGEQLKLSFITLEVRENNTPAKELYKISGFEYAGVRNNYYVNPKENAIIMTLNL